MKDQGTYLAHILEAIQDIQGYTSAGRDVFMSDRMRPDAVIRKIEIIGEAVKNLSDEVKRLAPRTPWRNIAGMRDQNTARHAGNPSVVGNKSPPQPKQAAESTAERAPPKIVRGRVRSGP